MKKTTLQKIRIFATSLLLLSALMFSSMSTQAQGCPYPNRMFPPTGSSLYINSPVNYGGMFQCNLALNLTAFTQSINAPVNIGDEITHTFGATVTGNVDVLGIGNIPVNAPATVTVKIKKTGQNGNQEVFQTEMLQMDIAGGTLPPGTMIRESPTLPSMGSTNITATGPTYAVNSFFDVFTELSMDGGANWIPALSASHMSLVCNGGTVPTLGEWGLIIFGISLLLVGVVFISRRKRTLVA